MHPQSLEYYEEALKQFPDDQEVVIVSDSPEWVMEQELFKPDRFYVSTPEEKYPDGSYTPYVDLCLMANCKGAIIANSTPLGGVHGCRTVLVKSLHLRTGLVLIMLIRTLKICIAKVGKLFDG